MRCVRINDTLYIEKIYLFACCIYIHYYKKMVLIMTIYKDNPFVSNFAFRDTGDASGLVLGLLTFYMLGNFSCFYCHLLTAFKKSFFPKILSGTLSECQTVWIQIRTDICQSWSGSKLFAKVIGRWQRVNIHFIPYYSLPWSPFPQITKSNVLAKAC